MPKITALRYLTNNPAMGLGTGKELKEEVFPVTDTLLKRIKCPEDLRTAILKEQQKKENVLPKFESFKNLRPYQVDDVLFLSARRNAGCFNEQRTGKTPTALSVMKAKNVIKLLIIAPASTLYTWASECNKWWFEGLPAIVVDGTAAKRKQIIESWKYGALIISYECLRETTRTKKDETGCITDVEITGDLALIKKHKDIQGVILDEAHRIKNHKSKQAEALFSLKGIPNKLALTGTPAPGKQHEIFSILHWLYPKIFTGYWRFIDYYFTQYEEYNSTGKYKVIGGFKPGKDIELQEFLGAIATRRLRAGVMEWLPAKDKELIKLPQTTEQEKYIQELNDTFEISGTEVDAINILAKLIKIRELLLSPELLGLKGKSPKIEWIKKYLEDYPEKKVVIFSNFTSWLKILGRELNCNNFIIGETPKAERTKVIKDFQDGDTNLLLVNIKAGKEGITLDSADVLIFTDKYPPVGDIMQAEDRFVATTKDKLDRGHLIIDLVMQDSYEENILKMLATNASEVDIVNNYIKYIKENRKK